MKKAKRHKYDHLIVRALRHFKVIAAKYTANTAYARERVDDKDILSALSSALASSETLMKDLHSMG